MTLGNSKIAKISNGTALTWLHHDHLGSTTMTTNSSGQSTDTAEYNIFGQIRSGKISATNYLYTGQEWDASLVNSTSGLYYYKSRYYDPSLGRFTTPDSIIPGIYDSQAFGSYSYVGNNPVTYTDPSGHVRETEIANILGWLEKGPPNREAVSNLVTLYWIFRFEHALGIEIIETPGNTAYCKFTTTKKNIGIRCSDNMGFKRKTPISSYNFAPFLTTQFRAQVDTMLEGMNRGINLSELEGAGGLLGIVAALRRSEFEGIRLLRNLLHEGDEIIIPAVIPAEMAAATTTTTTAGHIDNINATIAPPQNLQHGQAQPPLQPQIRHQVQPQPQPQARAQIPKTSIQFLLNSPKGPQ